MKKINRVEWIHGKLDSLILLIPSKSKLKIERELLPLEINSEEYLEISLVLTTLLTILITCITLLLDPVMSLSLGILSFSILSFTFLKLPKTMRKRYEKEMEKSLARAIRTIATELSVKTSFHTCLKHYSKENTLFAKEIKKALVKVERGSSIPEALTEISEKHRSPFIKRAMGQLIAVYSGKSLEDSEVLKKIAKEQESILKNRMKEYNQKLVVYSLIFIAISAVFPALFQAFVVIGSNFLSINISPLQALLIPSIGFPALNTGAFLYITSRRP